MVIGMRLYIWGADSAGAFDPSSRNWPCERVFPLFHSDSLLKEGGSVEGFAPQVACVTCRRKELEEKLVIRPTSEAIIRSMYEMDSVVARFAGADQSVVNASLGKVHDRSCEYRFLGGKLETHEGGKPKHG
jgi:hypothetical protein